MQRGFTKLFNTIVTSTIWCEDDKTRIVWITMLAIADQCGIVSGSIPGIADVARVSLEACKVAIAKLEAPDEWSRTQEREGRRIEKIDGGWRIVNHAKYRNMLNAEERREYKARWIAEKRRMSTRVDKSRKMSMLSTQAEAEAEAEAEKEKEREKKKTTIAATRAKPGRSRAALTDDEFMQKLKASPAYAHIDVNVEHAKCRQWCDVNRREPTRRRFVNWLNRIDKPLQNQQADNGAPQRAPAQMSAFEINKRSDAITAEINRVFKANGNKRVEGDGIDDLKKRRDALRRALTL